MKKIIEITGFLMLGYLLSAIGILMAVKANIGLGPWDALHVGIIMHTPLTLGSVNTLVGVALVVISTLMGEKPGWGTLTAMFLVGVMIDMVDRLNIIPMAQNFVVGLIMLNGGLFFLALGTYFYLKVQLGAGPRDGLMVVLVKRTGRSVRTIRTIIEAIALVIGFLLGAPLGIGTIIYAFGIGPVVQWVFERFQFDTKEVVHRSIEDDYLLILNRKRSKDMNGQ
ncbi:MAG: YczE/YyaS/YitT family protein [Bacillota bacterium]